MLTHFIGGKGINYHFTVCIHKIIPQTLGNDFVKCIEGAPTAIQNCVLILTIIKTVYNDKLVIKISLAVPCFQLQTS